MVIKKIDVLSCGKVLGLIYGALGLLFGLMFTLFSFAGAAIGLASDNSDAVIGALFGIGAVIVLPLFYGILGFIFGMLGSFIYNITAGFVGGIKIEVE